MPGPNDQIIEHRTAKATVTIKDAADRPLANTPVTIRQTRHKFLFGCNVFGLRGLKTPEQTEAYRQRFAELLNFATLPFYWGSYEPERGKTIADALKSMARWCAEHGVCPKGHPLVWHTAQPAWPQELGLAEYERILMERVTRDVAGFAGLIDTWDVINETEILPRVTSKLDRLPRLSHMIGRIEVIRRAFAAARAANPKATLILNDYETSPAYEEIIERCLDAGVTIDAIGIQSHMHVGYWGAEKTHDVLRRFGRFGKPLHFTELTIISGRPKAADDNDWETRRENWASTPEGEQQQAEQAAEFYRILFASPAVEAITWWDFCDQQAWMAAPSGFLRGDTSPKPVYDALKKLIKDEWWTGLLKLKTDEQGRVEFRGVLGSYSVAATGGSGKLELANAGMIRKTISLKE